VPQAPSILSSHHPVVPLLLFPDHTKACTASLCHPTRSHTHIWAAATISAAAAAAVAASVPPGTFPAGTTLWSAAQSLLVAGGLKGLWKGNTVNVSHAIFLKVVMLMVLLPFFECIIGRGVDGPLRLATRIT
jgi:hypothetical protein